MHFSEQNLHREVLPPNPPRLLFVRVIQLLSVHELVEILDEVGVKPEEKGAVIISHGNSLGGTVEHELGVFVYPGW